jgi:hypothetical protein
VRGRVAGSKREGGEGDDLVQDGLVVRVVGAANNGADVGAGS